EVLAPRYKERNGGYTRGLKAGFRYGDNAPGAVIEFVDRDVDAKGQGSGPPQGLPDNAAPAAAEARLPRYTGGNPDTSATRAVRSLDHVRFIMHAENGRLSCLEEVDSGESK